MTRKMLQPRKDALREQLALAADEIIALRERLDRIEPPAVGVVFAIGMLVGVALSALGVWL